MGEPLENYIRTFRRRVFISQQEMATLLGASDGTGVARHEAGDRLPSLETLLAYAFILQVDPRELYAGRYDRQARSIRVRINGLLGKLREQLPTPDVIEKIEHLEHLASGHDARLVPWED